MPFRGVVCPQCGSNDVAMEDDTKGVCRACGTQVVLETPVELHVHEAAEEDGAKKEKKGEELCCRIPDGYEEREFIRRAWIGLAREDTPDEAFGADFSPVRRVEHAAIFTTETAELAYQASIGYDRQEPYTDSEPYKEKVGDEWVTRYRTVTKYRTVTDWSPLHGTHTAKVSCLVENDPGKPFDDHRFYSEAHGLKENDSVRWLLPEEPRPAVTEEAREEINGKLAARMYDDTVGSLPGNHYRDVDLSLSRITDSAECMFLFREWEADLTVNGKTYTRHAYPFSESVSFGDKIRNRDGVKKKKAEIDGTLQKRQWEKTRLPLALSAVLSLLSVLVSLIAVILFKVAYLWLPSLLFFLPALAMFIASSVYTKKKLKDVESEINVEKISLDAQNQVRLYRLVKAKLESLGYDTEGLRDEILKPRDDDDDDDEDDDDDDDEEDEDDEDQ